MVDINNFRWWLDIVPWLWALMGYAALVIVVYSAVYHVFGHKPMIWSIRIMAFPVWLSLYAVARLRGELWSIRYRRLLKETFGITDWENFPTNEVLVRQTLAELAAGLDYACRWEERLRINHPINKHGLVEAGEDVLRAKARFWKAHALAKQDGYYVHRTYKEHLSDDVYRPGSTQASTEA